MPKMQLTPHPGPVNGIAAGASVSRITDCDLEPRSTACASLSSPQGSSSKGNTSHPMSAASEIVGDGEIVVVDMYTYSTSSDELLELISMASSGSDSISTWGKLKRT